MDVLPTISDIISSQQLETDGQSFLSVIENQEKWNDRTVFWHSSNARPTNTGDTKSSAIRHGDYKLIHWYMEGKTELYNIVEDPSESRDLSKKMPELSTRLLTELNSWKSNF